MEDVGNLFTQTRGIIISHEERYDRIRFLLPNGYMNLLTLVTSKQQDKIDKAIKTYTKDTNKCIEWQMVAVKTFQDIIDAYENYCKQNNTLFDELVTEEHIEGVELCRNEIIFNLSGKKMNDLDIKWQYKLAYDLRKNDHMFHEFESVLIQTTAKFNGNIDKKTNTNKTQNKIKKKNKNKNKKKATTNKNSRNIKSIDTDNGVNIVGIDSINEILDTWDMECKSIYNELVKRNLQICKCLDESFGILIEIENMKLKLEEINSKVAEDEYKSKQMERDGDLDMHLKQKILNVKNNIELLNKNLLKEKKEIDERNEINESRIKESEIVIANMKRFVIEIEKDEKSKEIQIILGECNDLINENDNYKLKMDEVLCKLNVMYDSNLIMNDEISGVVENHDKREDTFQDKNVCENVFDPNKNEKTQNNSSENDSNTTERLIVQESKQKYDMTKYERIESKILLNSKNVEKIFDIVIVDIDCMIEKLKKLIYPNCDSENSNFKKNTQVIECDTNRNSNVDNNGFN